MSLAQQIAESLKTLDADQVTADERARFNAIRAIIPGWSDLRHWVFFRHLAAVLPPSASILILGVYHGMDIALLRAVGCKAYIVGVDKFSDTPCADWPQAWHERSWKSIGIGEAPSLDRAHACLRAAGALEHTLLVESDDAAFMADCAIQFNAIYLDTAHDRATVLRQFEQIRTRQLLVNNGILCGDDYDNLEPTWGVRDAVAAQTSAHYLMSHRIWWADAAAIKPPAPVPA